MEACVVVIVGIMFVGVVVGVNSFGMVWLDGNKLAAHRFGCYVTISLAKFIYFGLKLYNPTP